MVLNFLLSLATTFFVFTLTAQSGLFGYSQLNDSQKKEFTAFSLPNLSEYRTAIEENKWIVSHENANWIFFSARPEDVKSAYERGQLKDYFLEYTPAHMLNDSMRAHHKVDQVHAGIGLSSAYKGKDVIIGIVDTGIDVQHPDFKDANGKTRILRYWDQTLSTGSTPSSFGYGIVWDSTQINLGLCTSMDYNAHGTTVAGAAAGNGLSTGYNQGVAPLADIIVVSSNLSAVNWPITVAQSCDYIFQVADSMGKKAVVNLSLGAYLGSHDGNDPGAQYINNLLDEKNGRIVVAACGNSGNMGKYHCHGDVDVDTNFTWFENNPNSVYGQNKIYFDLYSDWEEATYQYNFRAINPANGYQTSGSTTFRLATNFVAGTSIQDTIRNIHGDRIATIEWYPIHQDGNLRMQVIFRNVDSTSYLYGLYTTGSGSYDLWSGRSLGYNTIISNVPTIDVLPSIVHYSQPDANQTIVSNWNCSPKVVSVGNVRNRQRFANLAGGEYIPSDVTPNGKLSPNSSKGPTRHNVIKPDVVASGDVMLSPGPFWFLNNTANYTKIDVGGKHMGNGGTSMSAPVVAGIAALFLERCNEGNYQTFLDAIKNHSLTNAYTETVPNNAYGYGLISAHDILLTQEFSPQLQANTIICQDSNLVSIQGIDSISAIVWSNGSTSLTEYVSDANPLSALVYNQYGCQAQSDTIEFSVGALETILPIAISEDFLELSTSSSNNTYQWTLNEVDIPGATTSTYVTTSIQDGRYNCYTTSVDGCKTFAGEAGIYLGITANTLNTLSLFPNPTNGLVTIQSDVPVQSVTLIDVAGKKTILSTTANTFDLSNVSPGIYQVVVQIDAKTYRSKVVKVK